MGPLPSLLPEGEAQPRCERRHEEPQQLHADGVGASDELHRVQHGEGHDRECEVDRPQRQEEGRSDAKVADDV